MEETKFVLPTLEPLVGTYTSKDKLGSGAYGSVYRTSKGFAVKVFNEGIDPSSMVEISVLKFLSHPNVVKILGVELINTSIAMPLANSTLLPTDVNNDFKRKSVFYQLFRGLAYCHSKNVWHRDIKQENVLVFRQAPETLVKLSDFGLAEPYARARNNDTGVVTMPYRAPELLLEDPNYNELIDVWSLGIMFLDAKADKYLGHSSWLYQMQFIYKLLGTPNEKVWPGFDSFELENSLTRQLPSNASRKLAPITQIEGTEIIFDPEEYQLINSVLTWPQNRISAFDALNLSYFATTKDRIEKTYPAPPVIPQSCGKLMISEQISIPYNDKIDVEMRHQVIKMYSTFPIRYLIPVRSIMAALLLFDVYTSTRNIDPRFYESYAYGMLSITVQLYGLDDDSSNKEIKKERLIFNYPYIQGNHEFNQQTSLKMSDQILEILTREILTHLDFNILFPSVDDFVYHLTKYSKLSFDDMVKIFQEEIVYVLRYQNVVDYLPNRLAQSVVKHAGISTPCLADVNKN